LRKLYLKAFRGSKKGYLVWIGKLVFSLILNRTRPIT